MDMLVRGVLNRFVGEVNPVTVVVSQIICPSTVETTREVRDGS
jgi:hypothetical protein